MRDLCVRTLFFFRYKKILFKKEKEEISTNTNKHNVWSFFSSHRLVGLGALRVFPHKCKTKKRAKKAKSVRHLVSHDLNEKSTQNTSKNFYQSFFYYIFLSSR